MGETSNTIPPKGYLNLHISDFTKGLGYILFGAISAIILYALGQDHFPTWKELQPFVLTAATSLFGYIGKNYFTNNEGKLFTQDAPVTTVPTQALKEVVEQAATTT